MAEDYGGIGCCEKQKTAGEHDIKDKKMREIGGYIELDTYTLPMLYEEALAFNCGRNCLAWLIEKKNIRHLKLPYFLCESVKEVCESIEVSFYHIDDSFIPLDIAVEQEGWLYLVNFYGQLSGDMIKEYVLKYKRVIVDNTQAYFDEAVPGAYTIYTCRKYFGVSDGAFLVSDDSSIREGYEELPRDSSCDRMHHLLGRYEKGAGDYYAEYVNNDCHFTGSEVKRMSLLTNNLLHGIDYSKVKNIRNRNYEILEKHLGATNKLHLHQVKGAFAYPYRVDNGAELRKYLIENKIYIPLLWPNVLDELSSDNLEYDFALNVLPIPCDQRYCEEEMKYICKIIDEYEMRVKR